ncbi:MAG: MBL fold metallo-hydrolase [Alphaproteobacteria bacterium]|nr:MBL fold metallo-hydrolase [Alphaproteobacteria bacterium]
MAVLVRFWGVRGSVACPGDRCARYGGNTSCVEIRVGDRLFIFDAGTGLRELGLSLGMEVPIDADLFLTHTHMDHIAGIPFFDPFFGAQNRFRLFSGHLAGNNLHNVLRTFMAAPLFPVPPEVFSATIEWNDFQAGDVLHPRDGVVIRTAPLNHPNGATGYRLEAEGKAICYVTDTEHVPGQIDANVVELVRDADFMIYDSTYSDAEYPDHVGWGHSTWEQGVRVADAANVKRFVIFHHDPSHDDAFMDKIASRAATMRPGTIVAREGDTYEL